jgi:uncharacterized protein YndB with AHSA1/START domain
MFRKDIAMRLDFSIEVDINAPPDRVWAVMRDVERWPTWTSTVTHVRPLDGGPLAAGKRYVIRQPKQLPAKWTLTELDDKRRSFTWITRGPGMQLDAWHRVDAIGTGSRATLSIHFSGVLGPLFARLTSRMNDEFLAIEAKGLKERSEAQTNAVVS